MEEYDDYDNSELLELYLEFLEGPGNTYLDIEELILERMKECRKLRHGRGLNEYSYISDRDIISLFEDDESEDDEIEEYRNEILNRMEPCRFIGH